MTVTDADLALAYKVLLCTCSYAKNQGTYVVDKETGQHFRHEKHCMGRLHHVVAPALAELRERAEKVEAERDKFRDLAQQAVPSVASFADLARQQGGYAAGSEKWLADYKVAGLEG